MKTPQAKGIIAEARAYIEKNTKSAHSMIEFDNAIKEAEKQGYDKRVKQEGSIKRLADELNSEARQEGYDKAIKEKEAEEELNRGRNYKNGYDRGNQEGAEQKAKEIFDEFFHLIKTTNTDYITIMNKLKQKHLKKGDKT